MNRLFCALILGTVAVTPLAAQGNPAAGAEPARIAVPMYGEAVKTAVQFPGFVIREVTLLRRRDANGTPMVGARVQLTNTSAQMLQPSFRVFLYVGGQAIGALRFPAVGDQAPEVAAGANHVWTQYAAYPAQQLPDGVVFALPEPTVTPAAPAAPAPAAAKPAGPAAKPAGPAAKPAGAGKPGAPAAPAAKGPAPAVKPANLAPKPGAPAAPAKGRPEQPRAKQR